MARCPVCNCDPDEIEKAKDLLDAILAPPTHPSLETAECLNCGLIEDCRCLPQ